MAVSRMHHFLIFVSLLLLGCDNQSALSHATGKNAGNQSQSPLLIRSAEINPSPLTLDGPVSVRVSAQSAGQARLRYAWYVNGTQVSPKVDDQLEPELLRRGDQVYVEITPIEGGQEGPRFKTSPVAVVNTPPLIKAIAFEPSQAKSGDKLLAKVDAADPDHEDVRLKFKWWRNERLVSEGEDGFLDTMGYVRGDRIVVAVTPYNQESTGQEILSDPYILANGAPQFVTVGNPTVKEGRVDYTVKAVDPENDSLLYSLETSPSGMTIDEKTGHITWTIPPGAQGPYRAKVVVKDDHEGWASQELDWSVPARDTAS